MLLNLNKHGAAAGTAAFLLCCVPRAGHSALKPRTIAGRGPVSSLASTFQAGRSACGRCCCMLSAAAAGMCAQAPVVSRKSEVSWLMVMPALGSACACVQGGGSITCQCG